MTAVAAVEDETSSKATNEVVNETATVIAPSDNAQADDNNGPPTNPPPIFIQGLSVLSPRQKSNSNNKAREETAVVPLPPLRPEEPIASIRGALSEVIGFAHLTKYRLVVERLTDDGKGTTTNVGTTSNNAATGMTSKSTKGGNGKHTKTQDRKKNSKGADNRNWSPFTLGNALVTVPPSRSLDIGDENNNREEKDEREEKDDDVDGELVLDEYSDLSLLLPLLERSSSSSSPSSSPTTDPSSTDDPSTDSKTTSNNTGADGSIVLNASHLSIRVVLERYDLASVKDHLGRVRGLAEGNAPYVVTLKGEDEEELASASADGAGAADGGGGGGDAMEKVSF